MHNLIDKFTQGENLPNDEEMNEIANAWAEYKKSINPLGAEDCKSNFMMGMIVALKRMKKHSKKPLTY